MITDDRQILLTARRWVVKVGSALLTADGRRLDKGVIHGLVQQLITLRERGCEVVLVSSGAVAAGAVRLGFEDRPEDLHSLQAAAAVGQSALIRSYEEALAPQGINTALVLLSHADILARDRYLNARGTLGRLIDLGVIPVVNENDSVVTDEIRLGDNDTLAALVANLIDADVLLVLTDQDGLCDANPRENPDAAVISAAEVDDPRLDTMVGEGGQFGRGGMVTKLNAARLAARSGAVTVIANGRVPEVIPKVAAGEQLGTLLSTRHRPQSARKQWLASLLHIQGRLVLDAGAAAVVAAGDKSLLPVGVISVEGDFVRGDLVACVDVDGRQIARGLVNYSAEEALQLQGKPSKDIPVILGYGGDAEIIHRDNMVSV
ncbi:gamma-glutamyl kinase [marine gamma proteobacterium HTCC2080]|nr:gamma-glutamyl kinase [marine gamma proteobacterium HTCC2080]